MPAKSATAFMVKNNSSRRQIIEVRTKDMTLKGYLRLGTTKDDELIKQGKKNVEGSSRRITGEILTALQNNTLFTAMVTRGELQFVPTA